MPETVSSLVSRLEKEGHQGLKYSEAKLLILTFGDRAKEIIEYYKRKD